MQSLDSPDLQILQGVRIRFSLPCAGTVRMGFFDRRDRPTAVPPGVAVASGGQRVRPSEAGTCFLMALDREYALCVDGAVVLRCNHNASSSDLDDVAHRMGSLRVT